VELIIVRHGQTPWTITGQHTGTTEVELTDDGVREVALLAPHLARVLGGRTPRVFSSPRVRAQQTAELALPGLDPIIEPLLAEYDYGRYEGLTMAQIRELEPAWSIWADGCSGGETTDQVAARADAFLASRHVDGDGPVIAVTHGHFSRVLAARALGRPATDAAMLASSTASMSVVRDEHAGRGLFLWNFTGHDNDLSVSGP